MPTTEGFRKLEHRQYPQKFGQAIRRIIPPNNAQKPRSNHREKDGDPDQHGHDGLHNDFARRWGELEHAVGRKTLEITWHHRKAYPDRRGNTEVRNGRKLQIGKLRLIRRGIGSLIGFPYRFRDLKLRIPVAGRIGSTFPAGIKPLIMFFAAVWALPLSVCGHKRLSLHLLRIAR